ncbi:MAG: FkbM family methyltransferase [Bacteroidota bacterium]|nr:FkbM family methyltransferase [Bacteroidota bacterium]
MFGINLLVKSFLRPFPLNLERYVFKKKETEDIYAISLKSYPFPIFLRKNSTDINVFIQVFSRHEYDLELFNEPKTIIDCGANVGMTSVYFAKRFPNATIIAIEPEKSNFQMLLKNTERYKNIQCLNYGLWSKTTNLEVIDRGEGSWAFIVKEIEHENVDSIKAISIDEVMRRFKIENIDILKIDIEGSEIEVFGESSKTWLPKVKTLVLELHDRMRKGCTQALFAALQNQEYSIEPFCESIVIRF